MPLVTSISRRLLVKGSAAALAAAIAAPVRAQTRFDFRLIPLADLHSCYGQLPKVLAAVREMVANSGAPIVVLINGDIFERGNVVALRSNGAADFAFLRALSAIAPVIVNIGNHETALIDDPRDAVKAIRETGATVISNLTDARNGEPLAPPVTKLKFGATEVAFIGIGTDAMATYRQPAREIIKAPKPVEYAAQLLGSLIGASPVTILLSHAGVAADRQILNLMPRNSMLIGGHDHLFFYFGADGKLIVHCGSWGNRMYKLSILMLQDRGRLAPEMTFEMAISNVPRDGDETLTNEIARLEQTHLTADEKAEVANLPRSFDLTQSGWLAAEAIRKAANADAAFMNHTTFGDSLRAGRLSKYQFDAFLRFDGDIRTASVDGAALITILGLANQGQSIPLSKRTGDFVYGNRLKIDPARRAGDLGSPRRTEEFVSGHDLNVDPAKRYRIAVNGWVAMNQQMYLGQSGIAFEPVPDVKIKAVVAEELRRIAK